MKQETALAILKAGRNVYLTGAAGSGKTHVLNEYIRYLKERSVAVGVTASTGIAATHIGGMTVHSWSGIGVKEALSDHDVELLLQKERLWKRFDRTKVLVIDEVSMLSPALFDSLDRVSRAMKGVHAPFGGLQMVLSGDFFQLPPVMPGTAEISFAPESRAWNEMDIRTCYLDEQFRHEDAALEMILNEMRSGSVSAESRRLLAEGGKGAAQNAVAPIRLFTHNRDVDALNNAELAKLPGREHLFLMRTKGRKNVVESLKKGLLVPEELRLKKGAAVMFVKNNFEEGYVNGTLGAVEGIADGVPVVRTFSGRRIHAYPAQWTTEENGKALAQIDQVPLRLAWAITVHKSQGMSLDAAEIDLAQSFVPGQGYVALSRLRTLGGLALKGINEMSFAVHPKVFELDRRLFADSTKWGKVVARFGEEEMKGMHDAFIERAGGTLDEKEIAQNRSRGSEGVAEKIPTHEITRGLLEEGLSLNDVARRRGMTVGTIVSHIEKLAAKGADIDLEAFRPKEEDMRVMRAAFEKTGDTKLSPVFNALNGAYSYEDLRLARLFL